MADHEIKTKLKLEGESEYSAALKQSYQNLRVLNSELKKEQSALKSSATEQEKSRVKADALKKKIEEQKRIVETLAKALQQSKTQFGEASAETAKWQIKLNNAQAALNGMTNDLENLNSNVMASRQSMAESAQQTANLAQAWQQMGQLVQSVGGTIAGVADNMVKNIKAAVDEIGNLMGVAMASVGNWKGISDVYGGSDEDIQKMFFGMSSAGLNTGGITSSIQQLVKRTHAGTNKDALASLGIDESDPSILNHWDLYMRTLEKIKSLDSSEQYGAIENIFGSGQTDEVMAMMSHWDEIWGNVSDTEKSGGFLSQAVIDEVDKSQQELNKLQADWQAFQTFLGAELIVNLKWGQILNDTDGVLQNLMSFFSAKTDEDRIEALVNLQGSVNILTQDFTQAITTMSSWLQQLKKALDGSENPLISGLGTIVGWITDALSFLSNPQNKETIQKFLNWFMTNQIVKIMTGKDIPDWVSTIVSTLTSILSLVTLISIKNGVGQSSVLAALGGVGGAFALPAGLAAYLYGLVKVGQYGNEHPENAPTNEEYVTNGIDPTTEQGAELSQALADVAQASDELTSVMDSEDPFGDNRQTAQDNYKAAQDTLLGMQGGQELLNKFFSWRNYNPNDSMTDFLADELGVTPQQPTGKKSFVSSPVQAPEVIVDDLCDFIEEEILSVTMPNIEGMMTDLVSILNGEDYISEDDFKALQDQIEMILGVTDSQTFWENFLRDSWNGDRYRIPENYEFGTDGRLTSGGDVNLTVDVKLDGATVAQNQIGYIGPMIYDQLMTR